MSPNNGRPTGLRSRTMFPAGDFRTLSTTSHQVLQAVQELLEGQERTLGFHVSVSEEHDTSSEPPFFPLSFSRARILTLGNCPEK